MILHIVFHRSVPTQSQFDSKHTALIKQWATLSLDTMLSRICPIDGRAILGKGSQTFKQGYGTKATGLKVCIDESMPALEGVERSGPSEGPTQAHSRCTSSPKSGQVPFFGPL